MARTKSGEAETKWRKIVDAWSSSGLSLRAFATREGVNVNSLWAWKKRLGGTRVDAPSFVAVSLVPREAPSSSFELVLRDGMVLRIPSPFDEAALQRVVRVLEERR